MKGIQGIREEKEKVFYRMNRIGRDKILSLSSLPSPASL
jgi:hypothetical protein